MSEPITLSEIVAELREYASHPRVYLDSKELYQAAAAAIENLRAENARLHDLMDGMITEVSRWSIKASEEMAAQKPAQPSPGR
jgi:hypothetical protein